ncbi:DUF1176 domain-containing protein [Methylopila turkensis]|uniref:DUF1176 domain-containing protein n=1 Tax=Methylopila turkensis TaxID=1437816 RepID=A0A9W6JMS8_9HYPH|nr:DUF1176 domain-containing protein [Methylopila turkensis]GLK78710.1 hypothetical protein GCM10008174_04510 [Methylopila turkensis]
MRLVLAALCLVATVVAGVAAVRFEAWTVTCGEGAAPECNVASATLPAAGAKHVSLIVTRAGAKEAQPRLRLVLEGPATPLPRPRLALAVDGGTPVRLVPGADLAVTPGADAANVEIRLSEGATRRLLPFMRRGRVLSVEVTGEADDKIAAEVPLPGLQGAFAEVDRAQARADKPEALSALIGGSTPAALSGQVRDVTREATPARLRTIMVERDCPVWDRTENDPSFLADESFAADLGSGRTLWAIVCASGAYNVEFVLFLEDPSQAADRFEPLLFASFVESLGWTGVDSLSNVAYDPAKKQLTAFEKGRAAGDCGTVGAWEWGGAAFRMVEYRAKEECDGVGEPGRFPIVFRGER